MILFTIEDLARYIYDSHDHSFIREDWSGYDYTVTINRGDGKIVKSDDSRDDSRTFEASFNFSSNFMDGIDQSNMSDDDVYILLDRADDEESLSNPAYRDAVESLYDEICEWLDNDGE